MGMVKCHDTECHDTECDGAEIHDAVAVHENLFRCVASRMPRLLIFTVHSVMKIRCA